MEIRPYDPPTDREALWALKRAFELELGAGTGTDEKQAVYEAKLTDDYRDRYLEWVDRCLAANPRSVMVAGTDGLVGYVFVLPDTMAMIWDAAVLNEIYVEPGHRGSGIADDLMEAALEIAAGQSLPLDRLVLDVDPANERAVAFYERHGFSHWGELVARPLTE